jgi:hypothetical protein
MNFPKSAGEPGSGERAEFGKAACRVPIEHRKQKLASSFATRIPASFSMSTMKETAKSFSSTPVSSAAKASSRNGLAHPIIGAIATLGKGEKSRSATELASFLHHNPSAGQNISHLKSLIDVFFRYWGTSW